VCDAEIQNAKGNNNMNIKVKSIQTSAKPHRLADATVVLTDTDGDSLVISDIRILRNRQGQVWVAMPCRSVTDGGRSFQYFPQIEPNRQLNRKIEDSVLAAFEEWKHSQTQAEVRS
jgi:DNA-binding cell septation regulator SpoVG